MYQSLIASQSHDKNNELYQMQDYAENLTAHLLGIFNRSIQLLEKNIYPCWVFDGYPLMQK